MAQTCTSGLLPGNFRKAICRPSGCRFSWCKLSVSDSNPRLAASPLSTATFQSSFFGSGLSVSSRRALAKMTELPSGVQRMPALSYHLVVRHFEELARRSTFHRQHPYRRVGGQSQ